MNTFPRKGYGRIFVEKEEDIQKVKDIIKDMDEFEYSYLPEEFICVFDENKKYECDEPAVKTVYTHKFDSLNLNVLSVKCFEAGIRMFYWIGEGIRREHC